MKTGAKAVGQILAGGVLVTSATLNAGPSTLLGEVRFDHAGGFCQAGFTLGLSASAEPAAIYYTTNGEDPQPGRAIRYVHPLVIDSTTIMRVAAFDLQTNLVGTGARTFLFANDIVKQTGERFPKTWGTDEGQPVAADYGLTVSNERDAAARQKVVAGLQSLAAVCLIANPADLFSAESGIYTHPTERGGDWERPVWLELYEGGGQSPACLGPCGLRIHGGTSRQPKTSPKHSFRLNFKKRHGSGPLHFPVFGPGGPEKFDDLILRAGNNDSWLSSRAGERRQANYLRDEWMRRSQLAMQHPSAHGRFVQLYLNGLYWGVYNLCERPGPGLFARNPAATTEFDVRKGAKTEAGDDSAWNQLMALANAGVSDDRHYAEISRWLDLDEFADYMILNLYAGNSDWDRSANWYAIRPRTNGGRFQFLVWDGEGTLGKTEADTLDQDDDESPLRLFHKLSENAGFRKLFAARARQLLFNAGPLTPEKSAARFRELADSVVAAMSAEAARWGDYRRAEPSPDTGPAGNDLVTQQWQPEVHRILDQYFPQRRNVVVEQFRERGLYDAADQPQ